MSDVIATPAAATPRPAGSAAAETAVRVVDPSPDLNRLVTGENLRGTVVGKDDQGNLLVRTRLGVLQLAATRSLPVGTEVILQVRSVGPQVLLNLLPLAAAAGGAGGQVGQAAPPPPGTQAAPALPPNPHDLVQRGQVLRAVLHAAPPAPLLAGLPTAQPGAELLVRILSFGIQTQGNAAPTGGQAGVGQAAGNPDPGTLNPGSPTPGGPTSGTPLPGRQASAGGSLSAGAKPGAAGASGTPAAGATTPSPHTASNNAMSGAGPGTGPGTGTSGAPSSGPNPGAVTPAGSMTKAPGNGLAAAPAASGFPAANIAPGLRLAPQTPVASSGHTLATALQSVSAEAAIRAAGALPGPTAGIAPGTSAASGTAAGPEGGGASGTNLRVTGLVTATASNGQPILHTPLGTVTLDTRANLPLGASLALQITLPSVQDSLAGQALASAWPSLDSLEETLFHGLPAVQMDAVARALPQINPRLASGLLFFLSALNQGNLLGWMAPAAAAASERAESGELYERLGREFVGLNRSIETAAGEWRFVNLPLWSEAGLRELRCFFRRQDHHGDKGEDDGDQATRFVLELELKRHGELQLDGLVRARRFDLMLRSRRPLPALVRGDLMALFEEANAIGGYSGQLVFQASRDWLQMMATRSGASPQDGLRV
ncbi:MAG: hypothetical protein RH942_17535 [Kiloniellaceae bacterium]